MSEQAALELGAQTPTLTFEEKEHRYFFGGAEVPGVTRALEESKLIDFSMVPRHVLQAAQDRGTRVHNLVHYWLDGDLDESTIAPEDHGYLMAAIAFMNQMRATPVRVERFVHSSAHRYAGRLDLEALLERKDGKLDRTVIDWKTGLYQPSHRIQTVGYVACLPDPRSYRRMTVVLRPEGTFKVHEYPAEDYMRDLNILHAAVALWHWKNDNGLLKGPHPVYSFAL